MATSDPAMIAEGDVGPQCWLVLWTRGRRIGSVRLTAHNRSLVRRLFAARRIQADVSGTEHWALTRVPTRREIRGRDFD